MVCYLISIYFHPMHLEVDSTVTSWKPPPLLMNMFKQNAKFITQT